VGIAVEKNVLKQVHDIVNNSKTIENLLYSAFPMVRPLLCFCVGVRKKAYSNTKGKKAVWPRETVAFLFWYGIAIIYAQ